MHGIEIGYKGTRDMFIRSRVALNSNSNEVPDCVFVTHRLQDPLSYVLLFRRGENGWRLKLSFRTETGARKKASTSVLHGWTLFQRPLVFSTVVRAVLRIQKT